MGYREGFWCDQCGQFAPRRPYEKQPKGTRIVRWLPDGWVRVWRAEDELAEDPHSEPMFCSMSCLSEWASHQYQVPD